MTSSPLAFLATILAGALFSLGLIISGMVNPKNVIGFLDIFGNWDYRLTFVMVGAILINALGYHLWAKKLKKPIYETKFVLPVKKHLDRPLILGSALFGIGWGLGGICPGPGIVSLVTGNSDIIIFFASMVVGMKVFHIYNNRKTNK